MWDMRCEKRERTSTRRSRKVGRLLRAADAADPGFLIQPAPRDGRTLLTWRPRLTYATRRGGPQFYRLWRNYTQVMFFVYVWICSPPAVLFASLYTVVSRKTRFLSTINQSLIIQFGCFRQPFWLRLKAFVGSTPLTYLASWATRLLKTRRQRNDMICFSSNVGNVVIGSAPMWMPSKRTHPFVCPLSASSVDRWSVPAWTQSKHMHPCVRASETTTRGSAHFLDVTFVRPLYAQKTAMTP